MPCYALYFIIDCDIAMNTVSSGRDCQTKQAVLIVEANGDKCQALYKQHLLAWIESVISGLHLGHCIEECKCFLPERPLFTS